MTATIDEIVTALRLAREELGLSRLEVAKHIDPTVRTGKTVSRWERRQRTLAGELLLAWAAAVRRDIRLVHGGSASSPKPLLCAQTLAAVVEALAKEAAEYPDTTDDMADLPAAAEVDVPGAAGNSWWRAHQTGRGLRIARNVVQSLAKSPEVLP